MRAANSSNFLHTTAPRIAYANPTLPFLVSRIPMPFKPSKNAYKLNQDPNPPTTEEEIARMKAAESAVSTLTISFRKFISVVVRAVWSWTLALS